LKRKILRVNSTELLDELEKVKAKEEELQTITTCGSHNPVATSEMLM
jgi:hypothetical protein